jgi:hypothetical protein
MSVEKMIKQLGEELEMGDLITIPEPGHYLLPFDDQIDVDVSSTPSYLFKSVIGPCPKNNAEFFLTKMLEANLFGRATRGAVLGLNEEGNLLTLSLEVDYNSTYKEFRDRLEDFISVHDFWRNEALLHR